MHHLAPVVLVVAAAASAFAQPKPEGTRLFEEGRELAKAGKYPEACEAFARSIAIDRAPGTALNYGDCLEHLGRLREAWRLYDEAAREFDKLADARGTFARERADAVVPRLGSLTVKVAQPDLAGLIVMIGGESVPPQPEIVVRFEPGTIEVTARAPGHVPFASRARISAHTNVIVEVPALSTVTVTAAVAVPIPGHAVETQRNPRRVRLAIGLGAAGGVALIGGGLVALSARSTYHGAIDDMDCVHTAGKLVCNQTGADEVNSAATRANVATAIVIGGGALAATAVILFVTAPRETLTVTPMASSTSVGLGIGRSF
ncbi:hypothetical protein BH11MYX3_BH11MYX3_38990 [soil metagenome]